MLPVTFLMKKMTTRRNMSRIPTVVNVFHTNGTIVVRSVPDAFVLLVTSQAQTTRVTMNKIVTSTNPVKIFISLI